jgi:small subunit ribosomal protein S9
VSAQTYDRGTGRRKSAIAQVKLTQGTGEIIIDGKPYQQRFPRVEHQRTIEKPFKATDTVGKYNAEVKVIGGGVTGQAGAIRLGIARALVLNNENFRTPLRNEGLLTRDAREKERKKYGLKRARKAPQYTKR